MQWIELVELVVLIGSNGWVEWSHLMELIERMEWMLLHRSLVSVIPFSMASQASNTLSMPGSKKACKVATAQFVP